MTDDEAIWRWGEMELEKLELPVFPLSRPNGMETGENPGLSPLDILPTYNLPILSLLPPDIMASFSVSERSESSLGLCP